MTLAAALAGNESAGRQITVRPLPVIARLVIDAIYACTPLRGLVASIAPGQLLARVFPLVLARGYRDFNRDGGVPHAVFTSNFELYQAAELLGTVGTFHGKDALDQVIAELAEAFDDVRFTPETATASIRGERVLLTVRFAAVGRGSGVRVDQTIAHVWTRRGGRASRLEVYWSPEEGRAVFWPQ